MNNDKRAKFNENALERGLEGEYYLNGLLEEYCRKWGLTLKWYNESGETKKSWDFAIFRKNKVLGIIECETKSITYENMFKEKGLDLIYRKVWRNYPVTCYYVMPIRNYDTGEFKYILYLTTNEMKKVGYKHRKYTGRDRTKKESFVRVPFKDMKKLFYKE